jgi:hypothetical protein
LVLPSLVISRIINTLSLLLRATTAGLLIVTLSHVNDLASLYLNRSSTLGTYLSLALPATLACIGNVLPDHLVAVLF